MTSSIDSAVLALIWGEEPRVLITRKSCSIPSFWSCDVALPGGSIESGEDPIDTALREAWEEAYVHPSMVYVIGDLGVESAARGYRRALIILGVPRGPIDPRPVSLEVDFVGWLPLSYVSSTPYEVEHPRRGTVIGLKLPGDLILWGFTLRVLKKLVDHDVASRIKEF
ncbi:MAG: NUDIX domain-containing protein [Acidilobaceae archaeon]